MQHLNYSRSGHCSDNMQHILSQDRYQVSCACCTYTSYQLVFALAIVEQMAKRSDMNYNHHFNTGECWQSVQYLFTPTTINIYSNLYLLS